MPRLKKNRLTRPVHIKNFPLLLYKRMKKIADNEYGTFAGRMRTDWFIIRTMIRVCDAIEKQAKQKNSPGAN